MEDQVFKELKEWATYAIAVGAGIRSSYTYERLTRGKSDEDRRAINATLRRLIEQGRIVAYKMGSVTFIELPQSEIERLEAATKSWRKTKKQ